MDRIAELKSRNWWQSVGLQNESVWRCWSSKLTVTSKKLTNVLDFSLASFKFGCKLFKFSKNSSSFSSLSFQIKNMLPMDLSYNNGFKACISRKKIWTLSMKIHAYGGVDFVLMAVREICCCTFESNSKKLFLSTNSALPTKSTGGTFLSDLFYLILYSASSPAWCGILGYKPKTSAITKNASSGILPKLLIFSKKSPVSFTYGFPDFITGWRWWSKNSDTFSVGVP